MMARIVVNNNTVKTIMMKTIRIDPRPYTLNVNELLPASFGSDANRPMDVATALVKETIPKEIIFPIANS